MAAVISKVQVATSEQLEATISQYVAQGFVTMNRTPTTVTMFKKKEFNVLWAVIGFFLCVLPLLVYLIVYATQSDKMVEITLDLTLAPPDAPVNAPAADSTSTPPGTQDAPDAAEEPDGSPTGDDQPLS